MNKPTPTQKLKNDLETSHRLNERLRQQNEALTSQDHNVREQFTRVLNMATPPYSSFSNERRTLSWEEIFFQVGATSAKLINHEVRAEVENLRGDLHQLQIKVDPQ